MQGRERDVIYMYLKRINKKITYFESYDTYYVSDNWSQESDLRKVARVGVVVFQNARSRSWIFLNPTPQPWIWVE